MMPYPWSRSPNGSPKYYAVGIIFLLIVSSHLLFLTNSVIEIDTSGMIIPERSCSPLKECRRNDTSLELPSLVLNGTTQTYEEQEITIKGNITLSNSSQLIFRNCKIFMSPKNESSGLLFIDETSALEMENTTLASGGSERYDIQCCGIFYVWESRIESFDNMNMSNSSALMESSQVVMGNGSIRLNNSDLVLLNSSLDHNSILIQGDSEVHIREFVHVETYSSYTGPVELATVIIGDATGEILTTGKTDDGGKLQRVILERITMFEGDAVHHGPFSFNVTHPKYYLNRTVYSISGESFLNITLEPILGSITGRVTFSEGIGIPKAMVSNGIVQCFTDADGSYLLEVFAKTTYTISASREHYSTEYRPGTYVGTGKFLVLNFTLKEDSPPFTVPFLKNSTYLVSFNSTLTVEFISELDAGTLNSTTVLLYYLNGNATTAVKRNVELDENERFIHVTPLFDLEQFSLYQLVMKKEIRGREGGEVIWRDFSFIFKTDYVAVMTTVPEKDARDVGRYVTITVELTIPISEETLNSSTVFLIDEIGNRVPREVSSTGGNTLILEKNKVLAYNTAYTVMILPDLLDADGNSVFPHGYSFQFTTLREKIPPILNVNISDEEGNRLPTSMAPRLSVVNLNTSAGMDFTINVPGSGQITLTNLTAGSYNISVTAAGYEREIREVQVYDEKMHNISFTLKKMEDEGNGGRTTLGTIVVILVIMGMFLISIVIMGIRRWSDVSKTEKKENILRSSAPGMDAFEYRINPETKGIFSKSDNNEDEVSKKDEDVPPGNSDGKIGEIE